MGTGRRRARLRPRPADADRDRAAVRGDAARRPGALGVAAAGPRRTRRVRPPRRRPVRAGRAGHGSGRTAAGRTAAGVDRSHFGLRRPVAQPLPAAGPVVTDHRGPPRTPILLADAAALLLLGGAVLQVRPTPPGTPGTHHITQEDT
jgi:hypothetical protein